MWFCSLVYVQAALCMYRACTCMQQYDYAFVCWVVTCMIMCFTCDYVSTHEMDQEALLYSFHLEPVSFTLILRVTQVNQAYP